MKQMPPASIERTDVIKNMCGNQVMAMYASQQADDYDVKKTNAVEFCSKLGFYRRNTIGKTDCSTSVLMFVCFVATHTHTCVHDGNTNFARQL